MPRYFFNLRDGVASTDTVGVELPHFPAARLEAVRKAGELLASDPASAAIEEDWQIEVTNDRGLVLCTLTVLLHEAPAVLRYACETLNVRRVNYAYYE